MAANSGLLVRMLLVDYCYGIRSERLCEEVQTSLSAGSVCRGPAP